MDLLPLEIVKEISSYLSHQELAAACAVSIAWRNILDHDIFWIHRCRSVFVEYLKTEECKVKPKFVSPEQEESSLSPVGEWRMNFMRENHLWNNWRTGNIVIEEISERKSIDSCYFVTNNLVLITFKNKAQLFDISVSPFLNKGEAFELLEGFDGQHNSILLCERFGKHKCAITQADVTMVYNTGSPVQSDWELCHVFLFFEEEKIDLSKAKEYANSYDEEELGDPSSCEKAVIGNKFVGSYSGHEIHIWDIDSGLKLKEDRFLREKYITSHCIKRAENQLPYFVVALFDREGSSATYNYYVYSLDILNFLPFNVQFKSQIRSGLNTGMLDESCVLLNKVVAILNGHFLRIYKYKTSELLVKILSSGNFLQVLDSRIFFVRKHRIKAFNSTSESLEILPLLKANKMIKYFEVICNKFLLVRKQNDSEQVWETHKINDKACNKLSKIKLLHSLDEIRDLGFGFVRTDDYNDVHVNECCSRVIVTILDSYVVSFW